MIKIDYRYKYICFTDKNCHINIYIYIFYFYIKMVIKIFSYFKNINIIIFICRERNNLLTK